MYPFSPRRDLFPPNAQQAQNPLQSPQGSDLQQLDFNPPPVNNNIAPPQEQQAPLQQPDDFASRMKAIFDSQRGPAAQTYSDYLKTYPTDNKPSKVTAIGAALSGAGAGWKNPSEGGLVAQQMLDAPRVRALQDWQGKAGALKAGADLEDKDVKDKMGVLKEVDTYKRNNAKDQDEASLHAAQIKNYDSLIAERNKGKTELHEDKTTGHLISVNKDTGERKDMGVVELTPQQKADLQVQTSGKEENLRQSNRKDLFNFTNGKLLERNTTEHKTNRDYDIANPLPKTGANGAGGFESIDQQNKAISSAAAELNIENGGKYSHLIKDGKLVDPAELQGGFLSTDKTQELKDFYALAKQRAEEKLNKTRTKPTQSTATSYPTVRAPQVDSRIQQ